MSNFLENLASGNVIGAAISGLGSLASGIIGSKQSADNTQATNEMNYKIFKENQDWQEQMWNKQNDYNTPVNQLELYKQAGYNPLTALEMMNGVSGAGTVGSVNSPTMQQNQSGQILSSTLSSASQQIGNLIANKELVEGQAALAKEQAIGQNIENSRKGSMLDKQIAEISANISKTEQEIKESESRIKEQEQNIEFLKSQGKKVDQEVKNLIQDYDRNIELYEQQINLAKEQVNTQKAQTGYYKDSAAAALSQAESARMIAANESTKLYYEGKITKAEADRATEKVDKILLGLDLENREKKSDANTAASESEIRKFEADHPVFTRTIGAVATVASAALGSAAVVTSKRRIRK